MSDTVNDRRQLADQDLERRIKIFLSGRHVGSLRRLSVEARNGIVTLTGRVSTFYEKQLSQQCCRRVAGVLEFVDQVEVEDRCPKTKRRILAGACLATLAVVLMGCSRSDPNRLPVVTLRR